MSTYVAVTWTDGDTITEVKLDNMVANDQSEDAHAANGYIANNNVAFQGKDIGGTARTLTKVDGSDNIQVGADNVAGHTVVNAGTSKLVKVKVLRQDITTNTYKNNSVILVGWAYLALADGLNWAGTSTLTFGITFSEAPIITTGFLGSKYTTAPTVIGDLTTREYRVGPGPIIGTITTTTFTIDMYIEYSYSGTAYFGYTWTAIGVLA